MAAPRVAVVCDMIEENWPSMELVAEMLIASLRDGQREAVSAVRVCPPMRRRVSLPPANGNGNGAHAVPAPGLRFNIDRGLNRFWDYPRLLRRTRAEFDLFHIVDHSYGHLVHHLPPERTVVTCHDLHTFQSLLEPEKPGRSRPYRAMTRHILTGMTRAARVVFDTSAVRDAALAHGLVAPERARVAHLGVHPAYTARADRAADEAAARLLGQVDAAAPEVLHVGGTFLRKRIDLVLRVFAEVRRRVPEARLVRVGGPFTPGQAALAAELGLDGAVTVLPFVDRATLAAVYRRAALVIIPSEEEGFGLPVLEAMTCGTPVVASDLAVLREVGGGAATFVEFGAVEEWGGTVVGLLEERRLDPERWEERRRAGLARAARFSWSEYARNMVDVYQEVVSR